MLTLDRGTNGGPRTVDLNRLSEVRGQHRGENEIKGVHRDRAHPPETTAGTGRTPHPFALTSRAPSPGNPPDWDGCHPGSPAPRSSMENIATERGNHIVPTRHVKLWEPGGTGQVPAPAALRRPKAAGCRWIPHSRRGRITKAPSQPACWKRRIPEKRRTGDNPTDWENPGGAPVAPPGAAPSVRKDTE